MNDDEYQRILDASVELWTTIKPLLDRYGLKEGHTPSVIMVALGAVMSTTDLTEEVLLRGLRNTRRLWSMDPGSDLALCASYEGPSGGN